MTLSPVFRSTRAVKLLEEQGIWSRLAPALQTQRRAVAAVHRDLDAIIGERYRIDGERAPSREHAGDAELTFLQDYFFLILFVSLFESLGVDRGRLPFYAQLNFCIKGTITAADNLFDDQDKSLLPLRVGDGARFMSILQLMCFERLARRAGDRAVAAGLFGVGPFENVQRGLLDQMAEIGTLEGSEEGGVREIPDPEVMVRRVHAVRGGMLFGLAFVAPKALEHGVVLERMRLAEPAIAALGTAFQIVDDLTDFEFDLGRRSHNLLVAWIHHRGSEGERAKLRELLETGQAEGGLVETAFAQSARGVLERARAEARESFRTLAHLGFWFPPEHADAVVEAIVGLEGVARMEAISRAGEAGA